MTILLLWIKILYNNLRSFFISKNKRRQVIAKPNLFLVEGVVIIHIAPAHH